MKRGRIWHSVAILYERKQDRSKLYKYSIEKRMPFRQYTLAYNKSFNRANIEISISIQYRINNIDYWNKHFMK